ncbi:hypothetical protein CULT_130032 [[Clostridium] ultunense Esp]|nr:hypothetical protein CULT_130032 [[Clostridium] ultunense Esp]
MFGAGYGEEKREKGEVNVGFDLNDVIQQLGREEALKRMEDHSSLDGLEESVVKELLHLCEMKSEELTLMGYEKVEKEEIWAYLKGKNKKESPPLHRLVNQILSLKPNDLMNWLTINAYKGK